MLNLYLEQVEQNSRAKLPLKGALWSTAAGFTRNLKGAYPSYAKLLFDTSVDLVAAMVGKYYYRLLPSPKDGHIIPSSAAPYPLVSPPG